MSQNNKKRFCAKCAIQLRGLAGQFCEEWTSIIEIESALKKKKELELKLLLQQQKALKSALENDINY